MQPAHFSHRPEVTSLNGEGGAITLTSSGATVTITKPDAKTINLESSSSGAGIKVMYSLQWGTPSNFTIIAVSSAEYSFTINTFDNLQVASGTIILTVNINGVPVTGMNNVTVNSTPQSLTATANNVVSIGQQVTIVLSSNSSASGLQGTMSATRN